MVVLTGSVSAFPVNQPSPSFFECKVRPYYKYRHDGKAGRAVTLVFKGSKLYGPATIRVSCDSVTEETSVNEPEGAGEVEVLLPAGAGVDKPCQVRIAVIAPRTALYRSVIVPPQRQWTVYIYPHSHVDIGYTNTQEFVRKLHMRNIDVAIGLAQKTQHYPEGSRFVWNPEASWVTEQYLKSASPEKRKRFIEAVKKGWICLDGDYANLNTSACSDEELLRLFHESNKIQAVTGVPIKTMVQMDVAGASWGITQAAYQNGIRGFLCFPNIGTIRRPWEHQPFYWVAPDGKSKIFFLQALPYGFGYNIKGSKIGLYKIQGNDSTLDRIRTDSPLVNFIDPLIFEETAKLEAAGSPYSLFVMPWSLADNSLIDADLPDAVRLWNEKYAYPKLIIAGAQHIMDDFERRYQDIIPEIKGDYTEYWTDGLGSDARRIGLYRHAKENLVQAETAWSMLNDKKPAPCGLIDSAWKDCLLGAEHTWGYQDPKAPLAKQIEQTKAGYFENAFKLGEQLLDKTFRPIEVAGSNKIAVVNTLSWDRDGLVTLSADQSAGGDRVLDEKGKAVPSQRLSTGELVFLAKQVPALGTARYTVEKGKPAVRKGCTVKNNVLSNGILSVTIDPQTGDISGIRNLKTGREYVDKQSEYRINGYYYSRSRDSTGRIYSPTHVAVKVKENGPLVASVVVESEAEGCNWLRREVKLVLDQPWVDIDNSLDKISTRVKEDINFGFAFNVPGGTTRLDIPWGVMIPEYDQLPGGNRNWLTFQRWVDISNKNAGVTWTSIEAPLIELGGMTASHLLGGAYGHRNWYKTLTATQPLFSWVLNNHWGTNFPLEQGGVMHFHYGILPHGAYDPVAANRFGLEQNRPLLAVPVGEKPAAGPRVKIGNPRVFISVLKQSDDGKGMILRLRSVSDKPEKALLSWPGGEPREIYSCLADEKPGSEVKGDRTLLPYGTVSYYLKW
ncbi:glycoside hydrolase family 38 C-terminal domain-containing protein [Compostibacter hankyongensis]